MTLEADFLAQPGWLAAQKADFILGPVFVGLYWRRVRPQSRFGPLLIAFGLVGAVYIVQSSSNPCGGSDSAWYWEAVILPREPRADPHLPDRAPGREGPRRRFWWPRSCSLSLRWRWGSSLVPTLGPDGSISGCRALCPENALAIASGSGLAAASEPLPPDRAITIRSRSPPPGCWSGGSFRDAAAAPRGGDRRAGGAGVHGPGQIAYQFPYAGVAPDSAALHSVVQWGLAGARSLIWYGFLAALIAAQLFAGRALRRLVHESLRRPSKAELEALLCEPLGDPDLRLVFRSDRPTRASPSRDVRSPS